MFWNERSAVGKKYASPAVVKLVDIIELMSQDSRGFSINEIA
jgi:hypothetical protein